MATEQAKPTRRIALNARGLERLQEVADAHGFTLRQYLEALMHFGISQWERPGSWEAQGFHPSNYDERGSDPECLAGCADRWF